MPFKRKIHLSVFFPFFGLILFFSCTNENTQKEIASEETFLPKAERDYIYPKDTLKIQPKKQSEIKILLAQRFPEITFIPKNSVSEKNELFMPDRLGYFSKEAVDFELDSVNYQLIIWKFDDSLKTKNAFYNWLDCFGKNCLSLRINEEKHISEKPFAIWVSDSVIAYLNSETNFSTKNWENTLMPKKEWNFLLFQKKNQPTKWQLKNKENNVSS